MVNPPKNETPPRSFREKVAWISLLTTLLLYAPYFLVSWRWLASLDPGRLGAWAGVFTVQLLLVPVVVLQVLLIPLGLTAFWLTGQRAGQAPADERDRAIATRATRAAYLTLIVLTFVAFYMLLPFALSGRPLLGLPPEVAFSPAALLLLGFMDFVTAEVVRFGVQACGYRRGF